MQTGDVPTAAIIYTGPASPAWVLAGLLRHEALAVEHEVIEDDERIGSERPVVVYFYVGVEPTDRALVRALDRFKERFPDAKDLEVREGLDEE